MSTTTDDAIDGIMPTGPLKTGYVGYRDFFPDIPAFGTEYDVDRMSTVFDPSGSFQSDRDIVNILAAAYPDESAEQIADRLQSLTANTAMSRQFGGAALDPYSQLTATTTPPAASTTTPPASSTNDGILDNILGGAKDAVTAVGGVIDIGLQQLGDLIGMGDPSLVVLNPTNPNATVVYGTPTGSTSPTIIGNMPKSGAPVGVITGIPALDDILYGVFNQRGQGGKSIPEIIYDIVLGKIGEITGFPVASVAGAIGGGLSGDLNKVVDNVGKVVLQIDKKVEAADNDPFSIIKGPSPDGQMGPIKTVATGEDMRIGGGEGTKSKEDQNKVTPTSGVDTGDDVRIGGGAADAVDIVTGANDADIKTGSLTPADLGEDTTVKTGSLTPADLGEDTTVKTGAGDSVIKTGGGGGGGGGGGVATPATPLYGQGIRSMKTEKAGVTPLEDVFDIGDMSLANVLRLLAGEDDNTQGTPYYGGGSVNRNSSVDELIRLLRG